ncbi:hypothetical protein [Azospirillum sp. B510]|uniref:hypothetical protein n=1 Tax=Azospirillum sp. (strain B510) TaxID=137722 RepID=UPI0005AAADD2|nr:hypothetical protein [Azospirillum sp. B510]
MQIIAIKNVYGQRPAATGRRIHQAPFPLVCSCILAIALLATALYTTRLADQMPEMASADKWVVTASVVVHQTPTGIDSMFKR